MKLYLRNIFLAVFIILLVPKITGAVVVGTGATHNSGSVQITRYGSDLAWPSTAPSGTQGKVDSLTTSSENPSIYDNLTMGVHVVYATGASGYGESFGSCTYPIGGTECEIPGSSFTITPSCPGTGLCSTTVNVTTGNVIKVGVQYSFNIGDLKIVRISAEAKQDDIIYNIPSVPNDGAFGPDGTQTIVDDSTASSSNPSYYSGLSSSYSTGIGVHKIKASSISGSFPMSYYCQYPIGGSECTYAQSGSSNWMNTCSGGFCNVNGIPINTGKVTKVFVVYRFGITSSTPSSCSMSHPGVILSWQSVPGATSYKLYRASGKISATYTTFSLSNVTVPSTGTTTISGYFDQTPLENGDYIYSVVAFKGSDPIGRYTPNMSGKSGQSTQSAACSTIPAPTVTGPSTGFVDVKYIFNAVSNLPNIASRVKQTAAVSDALLAVSTPQLKYGFDWDKDGTVDEWQPLTGYKGIGVSVSSIHSWPAVGIYTFQVKAMDDTEVSSLWTPFAINIGQATSTSSLRISHYGESAFTAPYPFPGDLPSGTYAQLDSTGVTQRTDNPHDYASTTVGAHNIYVKDIPLYTESVGTCTYPQDGTECNVNGDQFTITPSCNNTTCSIPVTTEANKTTKVAVRYTLTTLACPTGQSGTAPACVCNSTGLPPVGGSCGIVCTPPQVPNSTNTACVCTNGGTGSTCSTLTCTSPQVPNNNGTSCICNNGGSGSSCACTPPQVLGESGFCQCPAGTSGVNCLRPSTPQIVTFTATPNTVNKNNPCNLRLIAQGVGSCTITSNSSITADGNGYINQIINTAPVTESTRFTATCSNASKTATATKNVTCFLNPSTIEN